MISIEVLAGMESELRRSSGNPKLVLADYFDYVAGTITGAIIATLIALGYSTDEIRDFYLRSGAEMFHKARLWERFRTKFESDKLSEMLLGVIGEDTTFGSDKLRTLLMMVLRNATTDSPWPLSNNPAAKYNDVTHPGCNLKASLRQFATQTRQTSVCLISRFVSETRFVPDCARVISHARPPLSESIFPGLRMKTSQSTQSTTLKQAA